MLRIFAVVWPMASRLAGETQRRMIEYASLTAVHGRRISRLLLRIERAGIDRTSSASLRLTISGIRRTAMETLAGKYRCRLESADAEGRKRELSFGDLVIAIEIESSI